MNNTSNEIIGYRVRKVCNVDVFVDTYPSGINYTTSFKPHPLTRGDAMRRLAAFLDEYPGIGDNAYEIVPVYREYTPLEKASKDLTGRLKTLLSAHGVNLTLTDAQIQAKIASELQELGASDAERVYSLLGR